MPATPAGREAGGGGEPDVQRDRLKGWRDQKTTLPADLWPPHTCVCIYTQTPTRICAPGQTDGWTDKQTHKTGAGGPDLPSFLRVPACNDDPRHQVFSVSVAHLLKETGGRVY